MAIAACLEGSFTAFIVHAPQTRLGFDDANGPQATGKRSTKGLDTRPGGRGNDHAQLVIITAGKCQTDTFIRPRQCSHCCGKRQPADP